jgi:hypothetical protein
MILHQHLVLIANTKIDVVNSIRNKQTICEVVIALNNEKEALQF